MINHSCDLLDRAHGRLDNVAKCDRCIYLMLRSGHGVQYIAERRTFQRTGQTVAIAEADLRHVERIGKIDDERRRAEYLMNLVDAEAAAHDRGEKADIRAVIFHVRRFLLGFLDATE